MYIKVSVKTQAKKEKIIKESPEKFTVELKERAWRGMANKRLIWILSQYFGLRPEDVKIVSGHRHFKKLLSIKEKTT